MISLVTKSSKTLINSPLPISYVIKLLLYAVSIDLKKSLYTDAVGATNSFTIFSGIKCNNFVPHATISE